MTICVEQICAVSDSRFLPQTTVNLHGRCSLYAASISFVTVSARRSQSRFYAIHVACFRIIGELIIDTATLHLNSVSLFWVNDNQDLVESQLSNMIWHQSFLLVSPSVFDVCRTFSCVCFKHLGSVTCNSNWLRSFSCLNHESIDKQSANQQTSWSARIASFLWNLDRSLKRISSLTLLYSLKPTSSLEHSLSFSGILVKASLLWNTHWESADTSDWIGRTFKDGNVSWFSCCCKHNTDNDLPYR